MKRWLILLMCVVGASCVWASEYASVVVPSGYIKKNENVILYNKNIEEIFAHDIVKTVAGVRGFNAPSLTLLKKAVTTNPQVVSVLEPEEKIKIVSKIFGANKVIYITVKYEIKSMNKKGFVDINKLGLISDNNAIRLTTKVEILDNSGSEVIWSNTYYKNINFDSVNNKDISAITKYYERLSGVVFDEMKNRSSVRKVNGITPSEINEPNVEMKNETIDNHHIITPVPSAPSANSKITPQLQLRENLGEQPKPAKYVKKDPEVKPEPIKKEEVKVTKPKPEKPVKQKVEKPLKPEKVKTEKVKEQKPSGKELKVWQRIKENLQVDLKSPTPEKEININDVKCSPVEVLPTYTDIHVKPRRNSKDYVPQFNNSVNDI